MWIVFFTALILTAVCSLYFIRYNDDKKAPAVLRAAVYGAALAVIGGGIADVFLSAMEFDGCFALIGSVMAIEVIISVMRSKSPSNTLKFMAKLILGCLIVELTVFQIPSYRLLFGNYPRVMLSAADGEYTRCTYDLKARGVKVNGTKDIAITYNNVGVPIGTVYTNVEYLGKETNRFYFCGDMDDETSKYCRISILNTQLIRGSESSQYSPIHLSGRTTALRFRVAGFEDCDKCVIRGFELNKPIPFEPMPLRVCIVTLLGTFLYACIFSKSMKKKFSQNRYICRVATVFMTILTLYLAILIVLTEIPQGHFLEQFQCTEGDQITEELVLTFEKGQLNLPYEADQSLLNMENPYDTAARDNENIDYMWDHVLFDGKYYSYYGVAPLLLFIPYHLITGYFFPANIAVMLFGCIGIILLAMVYRTVVKKWFSDISTATYISGLAVMLGACGIWFSVGRPCFYEISISAGFACSTAAAYFLLTANILGEGKLSLKRTFASSLLIGLAVLCRPTLAVYAICFCLWYLAGYHKAKGGKGSKKLPVGYMLCAALPLAVLGAFQMWYNYARFGSVLDFGIQYSLTVNDFTRSEFHLHLLLIGVYHFLLAPPSLRPDYPFVDVPFSMLNGSGYYFKDDGGSSGVLFMALPVFGYLLSGRALKTLPDRKTRLKALALIGLPCVVMPVVIVCSAWESGYSARYMADISWFVIIGALALLFRLDTKCKNKTIRNVFSIAMAFCAVYTVVIGGIEIYNFSLPGDDYPHYADALARFINPLR